MELFDYLNSAKTSLFRFESLQEYNVDNDSGSDDEMKEWWDFVSTKVANGVIMQRVRLITEPLTNYTKKELEIHKKSVKFGDDIAIIKENVFELLNIDREDFWLINDKICLIMKYSDNGEYKGFEIEDKNIDRFISIKNKLLKNSLAL